jgi:hypothetical protein
MKERNGEAAPRPGGEMGSVSLALSQEPRRPAEVWPALSPAEQQQIYRQIVIICRSLVGEAPPAVRAKEVGHDAA